MSSSKSAISPVLLELAALGREGELVPRGVALVEPQVAPLVGRDAVAEPHVRELVHHRGLPDAAPAVAAVEPRLVVERERLGLEREAERRVDHERAVGVEGITTDARLHPVEVVELGRQLVGEQAGQARCDRVAHDDPVVDAPLDLRVAADSELHELSRHRLALQVDITRSPA
jgi:hypothetical protein